MTSAAPIKETNWLSRLAHPGEFLRWSGPLVVPLAVATALLFALAFYLVIFVSPDATENVGSTWVAVDSTRGTYFAGRAAACWPRCCWSRSPFPW